jgi:hypothetical protein
MQRVAVELAQQRLLREQRSSCADSSSTSVTCSTPGCFSTSRTAMPSPPPSTSTCSARRGRHRRMHQRLVVAVLVARVELQVAVEEEPHARWLAVTTTRW